MTRQPRHTAALFLLVIACCAVWGWATQPQGAATEFPTAKPAEKGAEKGVDPHASHTGVRFADASMDFVFGSLILGSAVNQGCAVGEAFATAAAITDGDAASWQNAWAATAALVEARDQASLAAGHLVSARDQLLRAAYAYRAACVAMLPDNPRLVPLSRRFRELTILAGSLMDPPLEYVEIPFEGTVLPGYFRRAGPGGHAPEAKAPTLVLVGGAETYAEDLYFYIAPQAWERGYNFLSVDLPGQGLLPLEGRFFRPDMQTPLAAVADYALSRPETDPARLALYGISSGGGFAPQAAQHDPRVAALIMNNCVVDAGAGVAKVAVATATPDAVAGWSSFRRQTNQCIAWRFGLAPDDLPGLVRANRDFRFDPGQVRAPALIVVAEGENASPEIARQTAFCLEGLASARKHLALTPRREGAANHCVMENRALMAQVVFDWLDETFAQKP